MTEEYDDGIEYRDYENDYTGEETGIDEYENDLSDFEPVSDDEENGGDFGDIPYAGGGGATPDFTAETLVNLTDLRTPKNTEELCNYIDKTTLFAATKRSLKAVVRTHFSQDTILANVRDIPSAMNDFNIDISVTIPNSTIYDTTNPDYILVKNLMRSSYELILTRSFGPKRERIIQDQNRTEVLSGRYVNAKMPAPKSRTSGGILNIFK